MADEPRGEAHDAVAVLRRLLLFRIREPSRQDRDIVPSRSEEPRYVVHAVLYAALVRIEERIDVDVPHSSPACRFLYHEAAKLAMMTANMNTSVTVCASSVPK